MNTALRKIFPGPLNLPLVLPKKVIRESFNSNLMNEIAGLNSHSHSGAASFIKLLPKLSIGNIKVKNLSFICAPTSEAILIVLDDIPGKIEIKTHGGRGE